MRAKYFSAACLYSQKLICLFFPKTHYVMLGHLLRSCLDRAIKLITLYRTIRFKFSSYVAGYIAKNTTKRQQFKHDDVKESFYKLMNNAPYGKRSRTWLGAPTFVCLKIY